MTLNFKASIGLAALSLAITLTACQNTVVNNTENLDSSTHVHEYNDSAANKDAMIDEASRDYQTVYLAISDTGGNYYQLQTLMYQLHAATPLAIDTLNRYYNPTKKEIVVAENDKDEMYRGEYFPRRFPGNELSIEHMNTYNQNSNNSTFALVAAICETKASADSVLKIIAPSAKKAFVIKGEIYAGCIH